MVIDELAIMARPVPFSFLEGVLKKNNAKNWMLVRRDCVLDKTCSCPGQKVMEHYWFCCIAEETWELRLCACPAV